jgi:hypothetical protein
MKRIFLSVLLTISGLTYSLQRESFGQTVYDVTPGTKGNRIIITLENESKASRAENVEVKLVKSSPALNFAERQQVVKIIDKSKSKNVVFSFDIKRNIESDKKDTIEFAISGNGINQNKSFIINYAAPKEYGLSQNFPNPFNPTTTIRYDLPVGCKVSLKIYDILGNEVQTLVNGEQAAGYKEIRFDGSSLASGVYIYRLTADNPAWKNFVSIKKMMMVK